MAKNAMRSVQYRGLSEGISRPLRFVPVIINGFAQLTRTFSCNDNKSSSCDPCDPTECWPHIYKPECFTDERIVLHQNLLQQVPREICMRTSLSAKHGSCQARKQSETSLLSQTLTGPNTTGDQTFKTSWSQCYQQHCTHLPGSWRRRD